VIGSVRIVSSCRPLHTRGQFRHGENLNAPHELESMIEIDTGARGWRGDNSLRACGRTWCEAHREIVRELPTTPLPYDLITLDMTLVTGVVGGNKSVDRPRRATDEEPVDVRKRGERRGIAWIGAAAVENWNLGTGSSE
jgi:hypothetical protein